jgi:hypothetical protein
MGEVPIPEPHCSLPFSLASCPGSTRPSMPSFAFNLDRGLKPSDNEEGC